MLLIFHGTCFTPTVVCQVTVWFSLFPEPLTTSSHSAQDHCAPLYCFFFFCRRTRGLDLKLSIIFPASDQTDWCGNSPVMKRGSTELKLVLKTKLDESISPVCHQKKKTHGHVLACEADCFMGTALLVSSGFHPASCLQFRTCRKVTGGRLSEVLTRLKNCRVPKPSVTFSNKYLFWVGVDLPAPPAHRRRADGR